MSERSSTAGGTVAGGTPSDVIGPFEANMAVTFKRFKGHLHSFNSPYFVLSIEILAFFPAFTYYHSYCGMVPPVAMSKERRPSGAARQFTAPSVMTMNGHFAAVGDTPTKEQYEHGVQVIDQDKNYKYGLSGPSYSKRGRVSS